MGGRCLIIGTMAEGAMRDLSSPMCLTTQRGQASPTIAGSLSVSLPYLWLPAHLTQDPGKPLLNADPGEPGRSQQVPG